MKQQILITRPLAADLVERLSRFFEVEINDGPRYTPEGLKQALLNKQGMLVAGGEKIGADTVAGLTGFRAVCVSAAGYNNIDIDALTKAGVIVTNAPGPADETAADFAWGVLIAIARRVPEGERWVQDGQWKGPAGNRFFGTDIHGRRLGILGMGRIGQAIARRAIGFGMQTYYHNRNRLDAVIESELAAGYASKEDLLRHSDFLILSLPYTLSNRHIIDAGALNLMRPTAFLINIARGGLVDEKALAEAIRSGRLGGAALDVFEQEPMVHPGLLGLPNVLLTPHMGGATKETQEGLASVAADNLIAALGHGPHAGRPPAILNPEVLLR